MIQTSGIPRRAAAAVAAALLTIPSLFGCSPSKLAVGAMGPILENTKTVAFASEDLRTFNAATPSNLLLLEGLIKTEPGNRQLAITASMLYFSYAFTFDDPADEGYATMLYRKGMEHGRSMLNRNKKMEAAWGKPYDEFVALTKAITDDDLEAAVWTVANWSQAIALNLDSTQVLTEIPRLVALLERAIEIDGTYFEGLPLMLMGSLHAFRPPMMGGDPEASRAAFEKAIAVSDGKFLLASYLYAKFYCYRVQDGDEFERRLQYVLDQPDTIMPEYRLLNVLAQKKAANLLKEKDELF
ncbi:MAG: transporter T-component [Candidatus Krumholzibacteriota bacterium]|nr:transporter T-component [Candidatus Krumholzibacteriota bacterium]